MITVQQILEALESLAPAGLQESWDNSGLLLGSPGEEVTGVLVCLDVVPEVLDEAVGRGCNMVVSHHPPFFSGMKRFTGKSLQERVLTDAIRKNLVLYASHTNLDSVARGVSGRMAGKLGLTRQRILVPRGNDLIKLVCFVPHAYLKSVSEAIFNAGAGTIGQYDGCSFQAAGTGTFRAGEGANPFAGEPGVPHAEPETRFETIVPKHLLRQVIGAMLQAHPYEEVAYDLYPVLNDNPAQGLGIIGELPAEVSEQDFLHTVKTVFQVPVIRHSKLRNKPVKRVALVGGSGIEFMKNASAAGADLFLTADVKYHSWFEVPGHMVLADIGHFESEQFAINVLADSLIEKFPKFAVCLTEVNTNPIIYL